MPEHLVEPASAVGHQVLLGRGSRGLDRRQDAAARGQDLEVARAPLAKARLPLPRAGEQQVRVGVDEAGSNATAAGVEASEVGQVQPFLLDRLDHVVTRAGGDDPALPEAISNSPSGRRFDHERFVLGRTPAQPAGHRRDLGCPVDQQAGGGRVATAGDHPEAHPGPTALTMPGQRQPPRGGARAPGVATGRAA